MPLTNFGAILNFAENVEKKDLDFYQIAFTKADTINKETFDSFAKEGKKYITIIQRTRRENVTEMILEPIQDFERASYQMDIGGANEMSSDELVAAAISLEKRAIRYYGDAAKKISALPEVARALNTLAKKRIKRLERLEHG